MCVCVCGWVGGWVGGCFCVRAFVYVYTSIGTSTS